MNRKCMFIFVFCWIFLGSMASSQTRDPSQEKKAPLLEIINIIPDSASPGEIIMIRLKKDPKLRIQDAMVKFGNFSVEPQSTGQDYLLAKIPADIPEGSNPWLIVTIGDIKSDPYRKLTIKSSGFSFWHPVITPVIIFVLAVFFGFLIRRIRRLLINKKESSKISRQELPGADEIKTAEKAEDTLQLPQPEPPEELIQALESGEGILFAGAGLSARTKFPVWTPFIKNLVDWATKNSYIDAKAHKSMQAAVDEGAVDSVADSLINILNDKGKQKVLYDYLKQIFVNTTLRLPKSHRLLEKIPFAAAITTNFDNLLQKTFSGFKSQVFTPKDTEMLMAAFSKQKFFILNLYGTLAPIESVIIAPAEFQELISSNEPLSQFLETLFYSRSMIFMGASLAGIENFLKGVNLQGSASVRHYALVAVKGTAWRTKAESLRRRYGIDVLPYVENTKHPEVDVFLEHIKEKLSERKSKAVETSRDIKTDRGGQGSRLKVVQLENIGPFDNLILEIDDHWNILLGDNGVGKSTILKAIALGICGRDAKPYAERLIKIGMSKARVILRTTKGKEYITEILKTTRGAKIKSKPVRLLDSEGWLTLGFPPIRTLSWEKPEGPESLEGLERSDVDDLLPIISGEPDPRLDNLKQWIVNLDYKIITERNKKQGNKQYEMLRDEFFDFVDRLTEGITVKFKGVDPKTYQVSVTTDDGDVPIESISQGTSSLIGWVGIILQRFYEVYGYQKSLRDKYGLVLMDEIDAHMHPGWQQSLITHLKELFPNVQFVVTSHSPLIVGGMDPGQIFRLWRDEKNSREVQVEKIMESFKGWRIDQIVTAFLFGLESSRDKQTENMMSRYSELAAKEKLSSSGKKEFNDLAKKLKIRLPSPAEKKEAREATEMIKDSLKEKWMAKKPEERKKIMDEINLQMKEIVSGSGRPK